MSQMRSADMGWASVSIALGLPSTEGRTLTEIADEMEVTKQALSRPTAKFLRMSGLQPAWGLKSREARRAYQQCH